MVDDCSIVTTKETEFSGQERRLSLTGFPAPDRRRRLGRVMLVRRLRPARGLTKGECMLPFLIKRLGFAILTLFSVLTLVF